MADALASGASGGNPVEVQLLSTAPFFYSNPYSQRNAVVVERQTRHFEGVVGEIPCGFKSHQPHHMNTTNPMFIWFFKTFRPLGFYDLVVFFLLSETRHLLKKSRFQFLNSVSSIHTIQVVWWVSKHRKEVILQKFSLFNCKIFVK